MADIDVTTYSDETCLGKACPSLETCETIKGDKLTIESSKTYILYLFNTFYRGADVCNNEFTALSEKLGDKVVCIAVSNDADKAKTEKYLGKDIVDENTKEPLRLDPPHIIFDDKKVVGKALADLANLSVMSCPMAFIIKDGKIAWRQQFLQTHIISGSNFEAQLNHVLAGEELESNGPRPKAEIVEEEAEGMDGDFSLF